MNEPATEAGRRLTITVDVTTEYRTPEGLIANWRKLTKDQLIDNLIVYHEGLAEARAEAARIEAALAAEPPALDELQQHMDAAFTGGRFEGRTEALERLAETIVREGWNSLTIYGPFEDEWTVRSSRQIRFGPGGGARHEHVNGDGSSLGDALRDLYARVTAEAER